MSSSKMVTSITNLDIGTLITLAFDFTIEQASELMERKYPNVKYELNFDDTPVNDSDTWLD